MENEIILKIMSANSIRQIPIIDNKRKVVGLHTWENLAVKTELSNLMIIMLEAKETYTVYRKVSKTITSCLWETNNGAYSYTGYF